MVAWNWKQSLVAFLIGWKQKCQGIKRTVSSYPANRPLQRMFISMKKAIYVHIYEFCMTAKWCVFLILQLTFNKWTNKVWIILRFIQYYSSLSINAQVRFGLFCNLFISVKGKLQTGFASMKIVWTVCFSPFLNKLPCYQRCQFRKRYESEYKVKHFKSH